MCEEHPSCRLPLCDRALHERALLGVHASDSLDDHVRLLPRVLHGLRHCELFGSVTCSGSGLRRPSTNRCERDCLPFVDLTYCRYGSTQVLPTKHRSGFFQKCPLNHLWKTKSLSLSGFPLDEGDENNQSLNPSSSTPASPCFPSAGKRFCILRGLGREVSRVPDQILVFGTHCTQAQPSQNLHNDRL